MQMNQEGSELYDNTLNSSCIQVSPAGFNHCPEPLKTSYYLKNPFLFLATGFLFLILLFGAQNMKAGWILTGRFIDQDGKTIMQRYFIQDFKVKFEQYNIIYTFDLKTNSVILVDPVNLVFYQGTLDSYILGLKQIKNHQLQSLIKEIPENQKAQVQAEYSSIVERIGKPLTPSADSINIVQVIDSLRVFGKATEKYQVTLNNRRTEETWISAYLDVSRHFSWEKYLYLLSVVEPENASLKYMITAPYLQLLSKGFPVRRIMVVGGYRNEYQVNRMEEKTIEEYEFYTPSSCKELTLDQWINRNIEKEPTYDDYE